MLGVKLLKIVAMTGVFFSSSVMAQEKIVSRQELEAVQNPAMLEGDEALRFVHSKINVGHLTEDDAPRTYRFEFTNIGKETVRITRVVTSCGCTGATFDQFPIVVQGKGTIELRYNPKNQAGTLNGRTFVYTSLSDKNPTAVIALTGEVLPTSDRWTDYPKVMGVLRMKRKSMSFREVTTRTVQTERLVCVNSGNQPLRITAFSLPVYAALHTEPEVIQPGQEADIVVSVDGTKIGKVGEVKFPVILMGLHGWPSERTLQVEVTVSK